MNTLYEYYRLCNATVYFLRLDLGVFKRSLSAVGGVNDQLVGFDLCFQPATENILVVDLKACRSIRALSIHGAQIDRFGVFKCNCISLRAALIIAKLR